MFTFDDTQHHGSPARGASLPRQAPVGSATPIFDKLMDEWQRMFRAVPGDRYGEGSGIPGFGPEGFEGFNGFDNFDGYGGFDGFEGYDGYDSYDSFDTPTQPHLPILSDDGDPGSGDAGRGGPPSLTPVSGPQGAGRAPSR
ncbi:hypothetical protein LO772_25845 [Yinghuangia sp. ASG 101]|uniref:hypothetical protein n=1 Tax=Yinghuangia sp. ASG 101 TaxID=2896848 RepID=UPI001E420890|nr:hypothetical protein [Yinghuangia sp. ASG 101]UGQ10266.1 hypothetical protein LO772_25845 [Yinghuangia sp. ASG 101]